MKKKYQDNLARIDFQVPQDPDTFCDLLEEFGITEEDEAVPCRFDGIDAVLFNREIYFEN